MFLRQSSSSRALIAAAGGAFLIGLAAATPARALDDGAENIFSSIAGLLTAGIGVGGKESQPQIEYRERAPLVLPPNLQQLPPPGSGVAARNPAWPQDFDVQRHNNKVARERRPRDSDDALSARTPMPTGGTVVGARDPRECSNDDALERLCNTNQFWNTMRTTRSTPDTQKVAVGQEPPRRTLTDPPTGFRRQTTEQKYTFEVEQKVDISDARAQALEEQRRKQAIAEGRNPNF
jgi:hypothetical protein